MNKYTSKYYYKIRIIVTFALISILLVLGMSRASYFFVKDLYLQQLGDQLTTISNLISEDLDDGMISLLELGKPTETVDNYLSGQFNKKSFKELQSEIFIFDNSLKMVYPTFDNMSTDNYPELVLYNKEISSLKSGKTILTTPFEGIDRRWYLYSFQKIGSTLYLGIKTPAIKFSKIEEFDYLFWIIGISGIIIIIVISWFLSNSITRPVDKLVNFSKAIGDNYLDAIAPENMKGELLILSKAMDTMRKNILHHQKERENMLAQIAHEIRNPLGGIELLAGLTREDLVKNNLNDEYPRKILNEVSGLKKLITSYLNYSKPAPAISEDVDIKSLTEDIENMFKITLTEKNITLSKNIITPFIHFDKEQLKHILINLVANSIEAISKNGIISIKSFSNNGNVIVAVEDNGPGIEKENTEKIFEPFFTTKKDGIGLGLAISKKYCHENNAEIKIIHNLLHGVTFNITKEV